MRFTAFKRCELFQYVLCRCDSDERSVASFSHQIKSEYYGANISVSLEGIALEHFSALPKADISLTATPRQSHTVFHYLFI